MARVASTPNGNCFFLSVAYTLKHNIICNKSTSSDVIKHLDALGLINRSDNTDICASLRRLLVEEWLTYPDSYKPFLTGGQTFEDEAKAFLNDGRSLCRRIRQFNAFGNGKCTVSTYCYYDTDGEFTSIANYPKGMYSMHANIHCL